MTDSLFDLVDLDTRLTEISDLKGSAVVIGNSVDGEVGIDQAHLVQEALRLS